MVIIFGSVRFLLKNQNRFKPIGFGLFFRTKMVQNGLALFFGLTRFDLVFFPVWFRFGFFDFRTNPVGFFKILIVFSQFGFFNYFFSDFFNFFDFLIFYLPLIGGMKLRFLIILFVNVTYNCSLGMLFRKGWTVDLKHNLN